MLETTKAGLELDAHVSLVANINMGDLFWDKNHRWCDGSQELDLCYLVLSAEWVSGSYRYRCACFMWVARYGYSGAHDRYFNAEEVLEMTRVGNIASIKSFQSEAT